MCYAEFGDIIDAIVALDADVISIEAAQPHGGARRPGGGPLPGGGAGHVRHPCAPRAERGRDRAPSSPRLAALPAGQLWVNPDCGLKTRGWDEVRPALAHMVAATRRACTRLAGEVMRTRTRFARRRRGPMALPDHVRQLAAGLHYRSVGARRPAGHAQPRRRRRGAPGASPPPARAGSSLAIPFDEDGPQTGAIPGRDNPRRTMLAVNAPYNATRPASAPATTP